MALGENTHDTERHWILLLTYRERRAVLEALELHYNSPDLFRQDIRSEGYEVAHALGRVLQFTHMKQSPVEVETSND